MNFTVNRATTIFLPPITCSSECKVVGVYIEQKGDLLSLRILPRPKTSSTSSNTGQVSRDIHDHDICMGTFVAASKLLHVSSPA